MGWAEIWHAYRCSMTLAAYHNRSNVYSMWHRPKLSTRSKPDTHTHLLWKRAYWATEFHHRLRCSGKDISPCKFCSFPHSHCHFDIVHIVKDWSSECRLRFGKVYGYFEGKRKKRVKSPLFSFHWTRLTRLSLSKRKTNGRLHKTHTRWTT